MMPVYLQTFEGKEALNVWQIEDGKAIRMGVANAETTRNAVFQAKPGEDIWDLVQHNPHIFPKGRDAFHIATLQPGEYYPRIARPGTSHLSGQNLLSPSTQALKSELAIAKSQLSVLLRQLKRICETIHPTEENMDAYGHDIRNLLILACTEVESHWRAVLVANNYGRERYSTNDYVKLEGPMRLGSYTLSFVEYPWLKPFRPFGLWKVLGVSPTKELPWYDSYNFVKHDRETSFARAKLRHAFEAVAANVILVAGQFGFHDCFRQAEFADSFLFTDFPKWEPAEVYIFPFERENRWTPVHRAM
jgi:hypothetical protein